MARYMYEIEISHDGLNKYRYIRGADKYVVEQKAAMQLAQWDEMWARKEEKRIETERKESKVEHARKITEQARELVEEIKGILAQTLSVHDAIDWELLLNREQFTPKKPQKPEQNSAYKPRESDYDPGKGLLDWVFKKKWERKLQEARRIFETALQDWENRQKKAMESYAQDLEQWEKEKQNFDRMQEANNNAILQRKEAYLKKDEGAIIDYCEMVLANSQYPDFFPRNWDIEYKSATKTLIVDYSLPDIAALPKEKSAKYVATRDEIEISYLSDSVLNKLYDNMLYQVALRSIHELYEADAIDALEVIVFNGWVNSIDKATGQDVNACIMSVQTSEEEFMKINLARIEPKTCFKNLKGVAASKLHSLAAVAPVIAIDKEDRRFVASRDVVGEVDHSTNLAAMDWQDFENLIRELFEKEFAVSGGEVKVTQASRDGGVDAIAFDPDPIRGGKIVIQAKRYTNIVGVSAVRDLYGTVMNEGATKGILVTTADYGADAYDFVKGKPLTLLNGSNLLHMLEKHGHKAKIDIKEAKAILASD